MARWQREAGGLGKYANLTDGDITRLLVSAEGKGDKDLLDTAYRNMTAIGADRSKAFASVLAATVIAILVKLEVISSFSTSGVGIVQKAFKPIALTGLSMAWAFHTYHHARFRYFETWFEAIYTEARPSRRAELLMLYPIAFDLMKFSPANRGYPFSVWPKRSMLWKLPVVILFTLVVISYVILAMALGIVLAIDVWTEAFPNRLIAYAVVINAGIVSLAAQMFSPGINWKKRYDHYGLVEMLVRLKDRNPDRYDLRQKQIVELQVMASIRKDQQAAGEEKG